MPMRFEELCDLYGLDKSKCEKLKASALTECPINIESEEGPRSKTGRRLSKWQLCLKEEMTGKSFDPGRITELAKLYREGKCPK